VCIGRATKTTEGSVTCFVVTFTVAVVVLAAVGGLGATTLVPVALLSAAAVTAVELIIPYGLDNLVLPLTGTLTMWWLVTLMT
jgi:dolichol kinase